MCGIMGFVKTADSTISTPKVITEVFKGLSVRGTDASGWGIVGAKGVTICKAPVASPVITRWKGYRRHLPTADLMIGHTRDATSGPAQINKNNHPHCSKHLANILIHNGVIWESHHEYSCRSECDTEVLLRMIEALGMKEACKKMANFHFSMFAWLDLVPEEKVIYAYRDEITPCGYIDLTFSIGGIVIASTVEVVKYALYRAGLEVPDIELSWRSLKPLHLYKFHQGNTRPKVIKIARPKPAKSPALVYSSLEDDEYDDFYYSRSWYRGKDGVFRQRPWRYK